MDRSKKVPDSILPFKFPFCIHTDVIATTPPPLFWYVWERNGEKQGFSKQS